MKSKAPLALIEMLIMLIVFALAAGICLKAFALSGGLSDNIKLRDEAVIQSQNTAEIVQYYCGDLASAAEKYGGETVNGAWARDFGGFSITVTPIADGIEHLGLADITAVTSSGEEIFAMRISWQEGK